MGSDSKINKADVFSASLVLLALFVTMAGAVFVGLQMQDLMAEHNSGVIELEDSDEVVCSIGYSSYGIIELKSRSVFDDSEPYYLFHLEDGRVLQVDESEFQLWQVGDSYRFYTDIIISEGESIGPVLVAAPDYYYSEVGVDVSWDRHDLNFTWVEPGRYTVFFYYGETYESIELLDSDGLIVSELPYWENIEFPVGDISVGEGSFYFVLQNDETGEKYVMWLWGQESELP